MRRAFVIICSIATLLLLVCVIFWHHVRETGFSTRVEPTSMEAMMAGSLREGAIPDRYAQMKNPVASDEATLTEARAHFADHCAVCHGNNGDGKTMSAKACIRAPLICVRQIRSTCLTAKSTGLSRTVSASPGCQRLAILGTTTWTVGSLSVSYGICPK